MIIPNITGRLGNNLFMVAHAYAKAIEYDDNVCLMTNNFKGKEFYLSSIFRKIQKIEPIIYDKLNINPIIPIKNGVTIYSGYYQSENYFKNFKKQVLELFSPPDGFRQTILSRYNHINFDSSCAISIRRGDYLRYPSIHPVITSEYINHVLDKIKCDDYLIFSDDIEWCEQNISIPHSFFIKNENIVLALWLMSQCKNFIISNSSYSWWGAYMSTFIDKKVFAPKTWYGPDASKTDWDDIYCDDWDIVDTYYRDGFFYPNEI